MHFKIYLTNRLNITNILQPHYVFFIKKEQGNEDLDDLSNKELI